MKLKVESIQGLLLVKINMAENALLEFESMLDNSQDNIQIKKEILEACNKIADLRKWTK